MVAAIAAAAVQTDSLMSGLGALSQHFRYYGLLAEVLEHCLCELMPGIGRATEYVWLFRTEEAVF